MQETTYCFTAGKVEKMPICGRPLALQIDGKENILVLDSYKGLFHINMVTGERNVFLSRKATVIFLACFSTTWLYIPMEAYLSLAPAQNLLSMI